MKAILLYIGKDNPNQFHLDLVKRICNVLNFELILIERLPPPTLNPILEIYQLIRLAKLPRADLYFCEGLQGTFYIARELGIINRDAKSVNIIAEPLLFLKDSSNIKWWLLSKLPILKRILGYFLQKNTLNIIIGDMYIKLLIKDFKINSYIKIPAGINDKLYNKLRNLKPNLKSNKVLILASLSSYDRIKWKGIDLARKALDEVVKVYPKVELEVIGYCLPEIKEQYSTKYFKFIGFKKDLDKELGNYSLSLSLGFGDAFPISSLETMLAGIPTITSNLIGTSKIAKKVDKGLVVNYFKSSEVKKSILNYMNMSLKKKKRLSEKSRRAAEEFKSSRIIARHINMHLRYIRKVLGDC